MPGLALALDVHAGRRQRGDAAGQIGQRALDLQRVGRLRTRDRQRHQHHHAIGFDLEQALQHAAGLARREIMIANQKARQAVRVNAKVGVRHSRAFADLRADHNVASEMPSQRRGIRWRSRRRYQLGMRCDQCRAGQACQPFGRKQRRHRLAVGALTQARREQGERRDSPWRSHLKRTGPSCAPNCLTPACGGATEKRSHKATRCASSRSSGAISKAM